MGLLKTTITKLKPISPYKINTRSMQHLTHVPAWEKVPHWV